MGSRLLSKVVLVLCEFVGKRSNGEWATYLGSPCSM